MTIITRKDYMADPCHASGDKASAAAAHRAYYAQFVNERTIAAVVTSIGRAALLVSTDEHMNDIPLKRWDCCPLYLAMPMSDTGDYLTLAGKVCIAKEAARQWVESQQTK